MYNENLSNWDPTQTWGQFTSMEDSEEQESRYHDWFEAGHVDELHLDNDKSRQALHRHMDSFNKALIEATDRPFKFVVEPAAPKQVAEKDSSLLFVSIEPLDNSVTLDQLKEFTAKVKGQ